MPKVNAGVDSRLGDSLVYETAIGVALAPLPAGLTSVIGFVRNDADEGGYDGISPHRQRWTLKIGKVYLPDGPKPEHRLTCARLGGVWYHPGPKTPQQDGDYWLCDLQKA